MGALLLDQRRNRARAAGGASQPPVCRTPDSAAWYLHFCFSGSPSSWSHVITISALLRVFKLASGCQINWKAPNSRAQKQKTKFREHIICYFIIPYLWGIIIFFFNHNFSWPWNGGEGGWSVSWRVLMPICCQCCPRAGKLHIHGPLQGSSRVTGLWLSLGNKFQCTLHLQVESLRPEVLQQQNKASLCHGFARKRC